MAQSILQQARLGQRVLPSSFSQEGLSKALEQQPSSVWFIQEFAAFQGMLNRSYNDGMMQWLTDIYDVPEEYTRTLMSGVAKLRSPAVSILAASSPDWFAASFKESALRGGFLARFLYCPCFEPAAYVGHPGPRDDGAEAALALHLMEVNNLHGRFDISKIKADFDTWDHDRRKAARTDCPPEFSGIRSRAGAHALKATMLFAVSRDSEAMAATLPDLHNAIKYVEDSHARAEKFIVEEVANDKKAELRYKVMSILRRHSGRMSRGNALKFSKADAWEFRGAIDTLVQTGDVKRTYVDGDRTEWLVLTELNGYGHRNGCPEKRSGTWVK